MEKEIDLDEQYDKIYRYCYFRLRQRELAEDITQETFLRFLENESYRNTGKKLQYLYTIARNLCIDAYRRKKKQGVLTGYTEERGYGAEGQAAKPGGGIGESMEERLVDTIVLGQALEKLKEEDREMILLRYGNQVSAGAIAGIFGISRFAVYRRLKAGLRFLQGYMSGTEKE